MKKYIEIFFAVLMCAPILSLLYFLMTAESFSNTIIKTLIFVFAGIGLFAAGFIAMIDSDKPKK